MLSHFEFFRFGKSLNAFFGVSRVLEDRKEVGNFDHHKRNAQENKKRDCKFLRKEVNDAVDVVQVTPIHHKKNKRNDDEFESSDF